MKVNSVIYKPASDGCMLLPENTEQWGFQVLVALAAGSTYEQWKLIRRIRGKVKGKRK